MHLLYGTSSNEKRQRDRTSLHHVRVRCSHCGNHMWSFGIQCLQALFFGFFMTKKEFKAECESLEKAGWTLLDYEPERKYAKYQRNLSTREIGSLK